MWLVRSRRTLLNVCLSVIFLTPLLRLYLYLHLPPVLTTGGFLYSSTFTRVDTLLVGAAIALWLRGPALDLRTIRLTYVALCVVPLLLLVACMTSRLNSWPVDQLNPVVDTIGFTFIALIAGGVLLASIDSSSLLSRALNVRPLIALGRLSYGIYILHQFPLQIVGGRSLGLARYHLSFFNAPLAFALTYATAWLSFRFFESPFLRLKDRLAPSPGGVSDPPPAPAPAPLPAVG